MYTTEADCRPVHLPGCTAFIHQLAGADPGDMWSQQHTGPCLNGTATRPSIAALSPAIFFFMQAQVELVCRYLQRTEPAKSKEAFPSLQATGQSCQAQMPNETQKQAPAMLQGAAAQYDTAKNPTHVGCKYTWCAEHTQSTLSRTHAASDLPAMQQKGDAKLEQAISSCYTVRS